MQKIKIRHLILIPHTVRFFLITGTSFYKQDRQNTIYITKIRYTFNSSYLYATQFMCYCLLVHACYEYPHCHCYPYNCMSSTGRCNVVSCVTLFLLLSKLSTIFPSCDCMFTSPTMDRKFFPFHMDRKQFCFNKLLKYSLFNQIFNCSH